jgi:DNA-binding cell septation regulator SpoVG
MKIMNMRLYNGESKTKAFFDVTTDEGFEMKGFRLVAWNNDYFVGSPQEKSNKDGKWYDRVYVPTELGDSLKTIVLAEFHRMNGSNDSQNTPGEAPPPF